jgi:hypothetical protein
VGTPDASANPAVDSQIILLTPASGLRPSLLLADPAAELDADWLFGLIEEVTGQSGQLVTSLARSLRFSSFLAVAF